MMRIRPNPDPHDWFAVGKDGIQVEEGTAAHNNPMEMLPATGTI